jgi:rubrerythrin
MDAAHRALKATLEAIRDMASNALNQIGATQEERSMRWKCNACGYTKHFTKAVPLEAAGRFPRCENTEFTAIR